MARDDASWTFAGFSSPNFTTVPDEFFDDLAPRLNSAELKVLLYLIRRTFGFKKERDSISLSQMVEGIVRKDGQRLDHGTGLKKAAVCKALTSLEKRQIILRTKQFDLTGGAIATSYQLHMAGGDTPVYKRGQGSHHPCLQTETGGVHECSQPLSTNGDTQYTVINKQINDNVKRKAKGTNPLYKLPDQGLEKEHVELIAADILAVLGDRKSEKFYHLVARKVPEAFIRRTLSELNQGRAASPARVFTSTMLDYARSARMKDSLAAVTTGRQALNDKFSAG